MPAVPATPAPPPTPVLTDVAVERADDGALVVRWAWAGDGPRSPVEVSHAPTPTTPGTVIAVVTDATELAVPGLDGPRRYFRLATGNGDAVVTAERLVPLAGTLNFRDLGGYPAADGRCVRWGVLFRSDNLAGVTDADRDYLVALGVRHVVDFRHPDERRRAPSRLPAGVTSHHLAIGGEAAEQADIVDLMRRRGGEGFGIEGMTDMYLMMLRGHAATFGALLTRLTADGALPAVFHCTAGKDRTGLAAALVLGALGVPEETVLDDYELSTRYRTEQRVRELAPRLAEAGLDLEKMRPFLSAPRPVLAEALAAIRREHRSVEGYLTGPAGVGPSTLGRLRSLLLQ